MRTPVLGLLLTLLLASPGVCAGPLIQKTLAELSREAELVVHARIGAVHAAWDARGQLIWTHHELAVLETWKGQAPTKLVVMEPGGEVGDVGQRVSGAPRHAPGAELILFLKRDALGQWRTHGAIQGAFSVQRMVDGRPGVRFDRRLGHVLTAWYRREDGRLRAGTPVEEFRATVQRLAKTPEGR